MVDGYLTGHCQGIFVNFWIFPSQSALLHAWLHICLAFSVLEPGLQLMAALKKREK